MVDVDTFWLSEPICRIIGEEGEFAVLDVQVEIGENMRVPNLVDPGCGR